MSDHLGELVGRALGVGDVLRPRTAARFEPGDPGPPAVPAPERAEWAAEPAQAELVREAAPPDVAADLVAASPRGARARPHTAAPVAAEPAAAAAMPGARGLPTVPLPESAAAARSPAQRAAEPAPEPEPGPEPEPRPGAVAPEPRRPGDARAARAARVVEARLPSSPSGQPAAVEPPSEVRATTVVAATAPPVAPPHGPPPTAPERQPATLPETAAPIRAGDAPLRRGAAARATASSPAGPPPAEPIVHVHIGRVEVRAPAEPARPSRPRPREPLLSLEDYLASGARRRGS